MKKFLITFFIAAVLIGFAVPANSYAAAANQPFTVNGKTYPAYVLHNPNDPASATEDQAAYDAMVSKWGQPPTDAGASFGKYKTNTDPSWIPQWTIPVGQAITNSGVEGVAKTILSPAQAAVDTASKIMGTLDCLSEPIPCAQLVFVSLVQWIGNIILSAVSWILWLSGMSFNLTIIQYVVHMKSILNNIPVIYVVWQTVRDLANMFFIFILLYIAILTILDTGTNYKKMLTHVVLVALFLNFSFFITGVLIDTSNLIALQFYDGFATNDCSKNAAAGDIELADGCMSYRIVEALKLKTIYSASQDGALKQTFDATMFIATPGIGQLSALAKLVITIAFGTILMLVISVIFALSSYLILFRFIHLLFLLMFSPLAFMALVFPGGKKYWNEWWTGLTAQLIFIPVYFMFLWVVMTIITTKGSNGLGILNATLGANDASFASLFDPQNIKNLFGLIANYVIIIVLLGYSLFLAKKLGAAGSEQVLKTAKSIQGAVGRHTVGRAASRIANSQRMRDFGRDNPVFGRLIQKPFAATAGYSFGGAKGGYTQAQKDHVKDVEEYSKTLGPDPMVLRAAEVRVEDVNKKQTAAERAVETPFAPQEAKLVADQTRHEQELARAQTNFDQAKTASHIIGPDGVIIPAPSAVAAERDLNTAKANLQKTKDDLTAVTQQKIVAREGAALPFKAEKDAAQKVLEELKGMSEDKAKKLATKEVEDKAKLEGYAGDTKEDKERRNDEIKKATDRILEANAGVLKKNQKLFAAAAEKGIGESIAKIVPTQRGKRLVQSFVDVVVTDRLARLQAGNALRKLLKGKSKKDEAFEIFEKAVKDSGGSDASGTAPAPAPAPAPKPAPTPTP